MEEPTNPRIAKAIRWLVDNYESQPSLDRVAGIAHMSPAHFSRAFQRWVGVGPKSFVKHLTLEHLKSRLDAGDDLWTATTSAGLSGLGRVHDHFVTLDAVTPGEFRRRGAGMTIEYGFHPSAFGEMFVAATRRGVCFLAFTTAAADRKRALENLAATWPNADLKASTAGTAPLAAKIARAGDAPLRVCVPGTNFQVQVWRALLRIPEGAVTTYGDVARAIGKPSATRAVASAIGANPVSWLIPCHRVIRSSGALGGYRWGLPAKRALLAFEQARRA